MPVPRKNRLWRSPPPSKTLIIQTKERFPGRGWAEKGARWLSGELATNVSLAKRREYAKKCFTKAIQLCNEATKKAKARDNNTEAKRLAETAILLGTWLQSI